MLAAGPCSRILFHPDPEVLELARQFLVVIFAGTGLVFINTSLRTSIQAVEDTLTPLYVFGVKRMS